ncbi:MAG: hypothetical protein LBM76_01100 [Mycoplasmataceae bacterium]|nr:hypothetical protein [Mycoplasmataceae bacterium]
MAKNKTLEDAEKFYAGVKTKKNIPWAYIWTTVIALIFLACVIIPIVIFC